MKKDMECGLIAGVVLLGTAEGGLEQVHCCVCVFRTYVCIKITEGKNITFPLVGLIKCILKSDRGGTALVTS